MIRFQEDIRRTQMIATSVVAFITLTASSLQLIFSRLTLLDYLDTFGAIALGVVSVIAFVFARAGRTETAGIAFFLCAIIGCSTGVLFSASPAVFVLNACGLCALSVFPSLVLDGRSLDRPWGVFMAAVWLLATTTRILWRGPGFDANTRDLFLLVIGPTLIISISWYFSQSLRRRIARAIEEAEAGKHALSMTNEKLERSRSRALRALERARAAAQARSTFVANASHELRTPLTAIIGYSELVLEELDEIVFPLGDHDPSSFEPSPASLRDDVQLIEEHARQLLSLINDVLDLSKLEAGKRQLALTLFPLDTFLDELCATTRPLAARRRNVVELHNQAQGISLHTDRGVLRQVLVNLLSNAAKFTDDGVVKLHAYPHHVTGFCLSVQDTGPGIAADALTSIFDPFTQLASSPTQRGTGLGLALVSELCASISSEIQVHSEVGVGSTFTVVLPSRAVEGLPIDEISLHDT